MSEALDVGTLSGRIELEDKLSNTLDQVGGAIGKFEESWKHAGQSVLNQAASFFTAEAALDAVKEAGKFAFEELEQLTLGGAKVAEVGANFENLTSQAGRLGSTLLDTLHAGTRNTITDFELMKTVNGDLAAGMNLTDAQFKTLSQGAYALAKATGTDVKSALDTMNDAMLTGRTRAIALLTGKIDLAAAEDTYAKKLGTSSDRLTADEKLQAAREAILTKVGDATARLGDQTLGLDDRVAQAQTTWHNFEEDLGKTIATSPVLAAGLQGIGDAFTESFGGQQEGLILSIQTSIENTAITLLSFAETGADVAGIIGTEFNAVKVVFGDVQQILGGDTLAFKYLSLGVAEFGAALGNAGAKASVQRIDNDIQNLLVSMKARGDALQKDKEAEVQWMVVSGQVKDKIEEIRQKMIAEQKAEQDHTAETKAGTNAAKENEQAVDLQAGSISKLTDTTRMSKDELKAYNKAWEDLNSLGSTYEKTLAGVNPKVLEQIQDYVKLGASVDDLSKAFPDLTKSQIDAAVAGVKSAQEIAKAWDDVFSITSKAHGDDINDWVTLEDHRYQQTIILLQQQGKATAEMLDAELAKHNATVDAELQKRAEANDQTKAFYQKQYDDAKANYDLLTKLGTDATAESVRQAQHEMNERERDLEHWTGKAQDALDKTKGSQKDLTSATNDYGKTGTQVFTSVGDAVDAVNNGLDTSRVKIKTLSGDLITVQEAVQKLDSGGAYDVTSANFQSALTNYITAGGWNPAGIGVQQYQDPYALAHAGYSFAEIIKYAFSPSSGPLPPPSGPRIPGFKEGGVGDFGVETIAALHGKEAIIPLEKYGADLGGNTTVHIYVNGTAQEVAGKVADEFMRRLKQRRQYGAA